MNPELNVTIAAAVPVVPARYRRAAPVDPLDISAEAAMVKSALLYADRIRLASWRVSLVQAAAAIRARRASGEARDVVRLLAAVEYAFAKDPPPGLELLTEVPPSDLTLQEVEAAVGDRLQTVDALLDAAYAQTGWRELRVAVERGLVTIEPMGERTGFGFSKEAAVAEYLGLIAALTSPESGAIPMLDFSAAGVLEVGTAVGMLKTTLPKQSTEMRLAEHYVGYLPAFPESSMDAILAARRQLKDLLVGFRSAMVELSSEVNSSPVEAAFIPEADAVFRKAIAPRLKELADISERRRLLPALRDEIASTQGGTIAKTAIGLAAAGAAGWPG